MEIRSEAGRDSVMQDALSSRLVRILHKVVISLKRYNLARPPHTTGDSQNWLFDFPPLSPQPWEVVFNQCRNITRRGEAVLADGIYIFHSLYT